MTLATQNGSGSQTANLTIAKTLFRMGAPIGAKNLFPSNIQGLPTWFTLRVNEKGFVSREAFSDIVLSMNKETLLDDQNKLKEEGFFFYNSDFKLTPEKISKPKAIGIPFRSLVKQLEANIKLSKLLTNMIYVGVFAELLDLDLNILKQTLSDEFKSKPTVIEINQKAIDLGLEYAKTELADLKKHFPYRAIVTDTRKNQPLFIDGNSAAALGFVFGGTHLLSWYPITPSSSVAEGFEKYAHKYLTTAEGPEYAVVQAEDELAAINMVLGAGWVGARAVTPTSGPGLSLMAEAAGLSYFAEIPAVIWDVQRAGPSTGLPTRTLQGDLLAAYSLSHGDTEHIVLLPGTPKECFDFAKLSLDISEQLQTLVIVLSDLDLGMNYHSSSTFNFPTEFERGKVLSDEAIDQLDKFERYKDSGDGVAARSLPGSLSEKAGYFTRGTGHAEDASYSENPEVFEKLLNRLKKKLDLGKKYLPEPIIKNKNSRVGLIAYGSSDQIIDELEDKYKAKFSNDFSYLRICSLPLADSIYDFVDQHDIIIVLEQNRDGQMAEIIKRKQGRATDKIQSLCSYDGLPISAEVIFDKMKNQLKEAPNG